MSKVKIIISSAIFTSIFVLFVFGNISFAQMTGTVYKIQSDSVNFAGGYSTSTNYINESTVGEVGTGNLSSTNYKLYAGYQQMQSVYISISSVSDVVMSPSIGGITGGTSNGSTVVTVTTDSPSGYQLTITASSSPALVSGSNSFADYTTSVMGTPDYAFSVSSSDSEFAFSPEGADIISKFKDDGASCNTGSGDTADRCWDSLSTSPQVVANKTSANHPSGTATTLKFRAESGASHLQPEGVYTATTTVTALPL
jgi:hypothetical protein